MASVAAEEAAPSPSRWSTYPEARPNWKDAAALTEFGLVQEVIQVAANVARRNEARQETRSSGIFQRR